MKRTKERFAKLEMYNDHNISGLKVFDGEDLEYQDRMKLQTMQQNAWIQQQKYENQMRELKERMRSMLESEHEQKIRDMNGMTMEYNKKLAQMKRDREAKEKYDENALDEYNIQDAENTRNVAYAHLKAEIEAAKEAIY